MAILDEVVHCTLPCETNTIEGEKNVLFQGRILVSWAIFMTHTDVLKIPLIFSFIHSICIYKLLVSLCKVFVGRYKRVSSTASTWSNWENKLYLPKTISRQDNIKYIL